MKSSTLLCLNGISIKIIRRRLPKKFIFTTTPEEIQDIQQIDRERKQLMNGGEHDEMVKVELQKMTKSIHIITKKWEIEVEAEKRLTISNAANTE